MNQANDPTNCGGCGTRCQGATPYCGSGTCGPAPCERDGAACAGGGLCCGSACCAAGDLCCDPQGPLSTTPVCYTPTAAASTCPQGCAPLCISDRNQKKDFEPVDAEEILMRLRRLPLSTWTYLDEPTGLRHLGPMAQDFRASFGLGDSDDRHYNAVDAHGVALAAIQALDRLSKAQQERLRELERQNRALSRRIRILEGRR